MADACVEREKASPKEKHKRKLIKETKRITCSFLAFWMTMQSYEVPFKKMLIHDFSYRGALFYNNAMWIKYFQLATGKAISTLIILL